MGSRAAHPHRAVRPRPGPLLEALADGRQPDDEAIAPGGYTVGLDATSGEVKLSMVFSSATAS